MSKSLRIYLAILSFLVFVWLWWSAPNVAVVGKSNWLGLITISSLYICSHFLRMFRLILLTLDKRNFAFPLITAHALTAFPSSFLPFKIGEILRLAAFLCVYENRHKAIAVWLTERFGDILVITTFILFIYLSDIKIPSEMLTVFIIFILASGVGLFGFFAVANVSVYLNRHLVLTSLSTRGLMILRASDFLRNLEINIHSCLDGRKTGFLLVSLLIWSLEIFALLLSIEWLLISESKFTELFASALLASLPSSTQSAFGVYQSVALVIITIVFLLGAWLTSYFKIKGR